jgi:glycogen operon protein
MDGGALDKLLGTTPLRDKIERLNAAETIDYTAVSNIKLRALHVLHRAFRKRHLGTTPSALGEAFLYFRETEGGPLRDYAVFETLSAWFAERQAAPLPWMCWPAEFREPNTGAVERFEQEHSEQVEFYVYLQWLARNQWQTAAQRARNAGMEIGLMTDLALGTDLDSAEAWQWPGLMALDAELGAPPDAFAPRGQAWGAPPWRPHSLVDRKYAPFAALLKVVMRDAGAVRMDHVMGLMRQFWIPRGDTPGQGAYVSYPFHALLDCVAEASKQFNCMVIGEDLGNPPAGLREHITAAGMLGYRVLYFERDRSGRFIPPEAYTELAAATASTHDLPTLNGFLAGTDIDDREAYGLYASTAQAHAMRAERQLALRALESLLVSYGGENALHLFADSAHRFLAATASRLIIVQIEDVLGLQHQANLPGLGDETPNWRRRLPVSLDDLATDPRLHKLATIFAERSRFSQASRTVP